ncbi:MAG: hypothetical protein KatS3mg094_004 [Candidatus Parcubacteria bacterium]|nr:MAG: hypothetical protein KatS3mg094_004 [Candidatus Parcubacteria bacterium]
MVFIISFLISSVLFIIFSFFIPKRTKKGAEAYWKILGFKEYINKAEKYRAKFYETENIFEKYLPYSIIFNLVNKWASVFEDVYKSPPSWYEAKIDQIADFPTFIYSLNRSIDRMNSVFVAKSKGESNRIVRKNSFSSGFSGGGYGGGGGKSW